MKICILTQPLKFNYGGILQAYALQKVLKDMGHNVLTLNYDSTFKLTKKTIIKRIIAKLLWGKRISLLGRIAFPELNKHLRRFISENIDYSELLYAPLKYEHIDKFKFDAFIVGSDQVWRKAYSPHLPTFFLDFLEKNRNVKKIAYSASFGTSEFEVPSSELNQYIRWTQEFNNISVREKDAIKIIRDDLKSNAELVLDPTMLLTPSDYLELIDSDKSRNLIDKDIPKNQCMGYVLDINKNKKSLFDNISKKLGLTGNILSIQQFPPKDFNLDSCIQPPITQWLQMIKNSSFVVTDSFHGTVFSIIFNTPFAVVSNNERGASRFNTLLETFNLKDRMISPDDANATEKILNSKIDWNNVNTILKQCRETSKCFLKSALK